MPTSIHIPPPLLAALDRRARRLGLSRNRLIVRAIEREIQEGAGWSEGFLQQLAQPGAGVAEAVDELLRSVRRARRSKRPPPL